MAYTRINVFNFIPLPQASEAKALKEKIIKHMLATRSDEIVSELEFHGRKRGAGFVLNLVQVHEETEMSRDWNEIMGTGESKVGALQALQNLAEDCGCPTEEKEGNKRKLQEKEAVANKKQKPC